MIISLPYKIIWIKSLRFEVGRERITVYKGVLKKIQQNIPLQKVTDFKLERSLFERFLGIGSIQIQTAGQSITRTSYEGVLLGILDYDKLLEELKLLLNHVQTGQTPATEANDKNIHEKILDELIKIRLLLQKQKKIRFI